MQTIKNILLLAIVLNFVSCKKEKNTSVVLNGNLDSLFDISNYININEKYLNDSIFEFSASKDNLHITGKINKKNNNKVDWWTIYDKANGEKYISIQFITEVDKEKKSQVLFFNKSQIDTIRSKFYTVDFTNSQKIVYNFYTPKSAFITKNKDFTYAVFTNNELIENKKISCLSKTNHHHYCEIDLSNFTNKNNIFIGGIFSVYSYDAKSQEMGINEIFINDTIKIK